MKIQAIALLCLFGFATCQESELKLCDETKENEFFNTLDGCSNLARADFIVAAFSQDYIFAACELINKRLDCWKESNLQYNCLTEKEMSNVKSNVLFEELERASNNSELLGDEYVASCPTLIKFKKDFIKERYGASSCTFQDIQQGIPREKACTNKLNNKIEFLASIASGVDAWTRVFCLEHLEEKKCFEFLYNCRDSQHKAEKDAINAPIYAKREERIRNFGIEDFSFDQCSVARRGKRAAFSAPLTADQEAALHQYFSK